METPSKRIPGDITMLALIMLLVILGSMYIGHLISTRSADSPKPTLAVDPWKDKMYIVEPVKGLGVRVGLGVCYVLLTKTTQPPTPVAISCI